LFELVHGLIDLSLGQLNSVLNCSGKFLDLIFASHIAMHSYLNSELFPVLKTSTILHLRLLKH